MDKSNFRISKSKLFKNNLKGSEIQAVLFFRPRWNVTKARAWLKKHDIKPLTFLDPSKQNPDTKLFKKQIRFRITPPEQYKSFITKKLDQTASDGSMLDGDINLIIGFKTAPSQGGTKSGLGQPSATKFKRPKTLHIKRRPLGKRKKFGK